MYAQAALKNHRNLISNACHSRILNSSQDHHRHQLELLLLSRRDGCAAVPDALSRMAKAYLAVIGFIQQVCPVPLLSSG